MGMTMRLAQGAAGGLDYALVANRDYRGPQTLVVKLRSKWLGIESWYTPTRPGPRRGGRESAAA